MKSPEREPIINVEPYIKTDPSKVEDVVISGASVKGLAYAFAFEELEKRGLSLKQIKRFAGSSAGAIAVFLAAIGCNPSEIKTFLLKLFDINNFKEKATSHTERKGANFFGKRTKASRTAAAVKFAPKGGYSLVRNYGLVSPDVFSRMFRAILKEKTGDEFLTFAELKKLKRPNSDEGYPELYITGADLNSGKTVVYCAGNTPHGLIAQSVVLSMSIPGVFAAGHMWYKDPKKEPDDVGYVYEDPEKHFIVDGGTNDNTPRWIFENDPPAGRGNPVSNPAMLVLRIESQEYIDWIKGKTDTPPLREIDSVAGFLTALYDFTRQSESNQLERKNQDDTIFIPNRGVGTLDFGLTPKQITELKDAGREAVDAFFATERSLTFESV